MRRTIRTAFVALLMLAPPATAQQPRPQISIPAPVTPAAIPTVRAGVDLWRAGDYPAAVAIWKPFAAAGDADAMFNMGQAYKLGRAVPVDKALARDWYRKAAAKNHMPAQANLGILLFQAGDKAEAARWLKVAADRGEMRAQYVLGVAHWNGDGVARNLAIAQAYLTRASEQGLAEATGALNNLSRTLSPADRANGAVIAASLAAGNGVPMTIASTSTSTTPSPPAPSTGITAADLNRRGLDIVQKPAPRPAEMAATPAAAPPTTASVVRSVELPAANAQTGPEKPAELARSADKAGEQVLEKPGNTDKIAAVRSKAAEPGKFAGKVGAPAAVKAAEKPKAGEKVKPVEAAAPGWRVQLGAFGSRAQAETAWASVKTKQKATLAKIKPMYDQGRSIVKLQLGPYKTRAEAKDFCAKLAFAGQACFVTEG